MLQSNQEGQNSSILIREVWASNLAYEFYLIRGVVGRYPFISMDTEFPGVIHSPQVDAPNPSRRRQLHPIDCYRYLKANVDDLKLIQVGLTLTDADGNLPQFGTNQGYIWQFNFCDFDPARDHHNPDSIDLLRRQGIDFNSNISHGIDSVHFGEMLMNSGLVLNKAVTWVTFHSAYDFGYLVKILTRQNLPDRLEDFLYVLRMFFGDNVYDIKHMIRFCNALYGGLERVASTLNVDRAVGKSHQAGSDSLLTWHAFQRMMNVYFVDSEAHQHAGVLFGLEMTV
ncbi:probable CCR4-associated factor 1 homolog 11 [Cicer arietinum]|uniref:poly(A)-specific ribonuclease n=1 Tax=Cicer arietinum TaxID=3827 RepID=A0A1S3EAJ3_CICAR|nr:probable CCR4-associated factor 1 homolog 11 [Cicer arietinum]XP_012572423.1 probable CCR4-associated factor 1 homolog 11 [Cicer arietinum]XP_012572426.1 probable CCR4-associated factor 1 homolog 11 [Cicer arietinum]